MSAKDPTSPGITGTQNAALMRYATYASVSVACVLILMKMTAFLITDSVALLTSLIDSVLDSLASVINLIAVRHAVTPADREHRFGHGKAEPLAGLGQAAFISGSSIFLIVESINRLLHPVAVQHGTIGITVMLISLLMTVALLAYQRYVIRKTNSLAIRADSLHYLSDITLNISVIAALILSVHLRWIAADPVFALGIAAFILFSAQKIARQSLDQLMDRELPDSERQKIMEICRRHPEVGDIHDLRTRMSGQRRFIQLHLEMDGDLSLVCAHAIADAVELDLTLEFPEADIIIHEDPKGLEEPGTR